MRAIGVMSGTSLDGIDVAEVDVDAAADRAVRGIAVRVRNFQTVEFGATLRAAIAEAMPPHSGSTAGVAELNTAVGEAIADAILRCTRTWKTDLSACDVIGSHGHTLYHRPSDGVTMQIGEPAVIACRTGVTCVADFRVADVAAGGQGAPLVSFVDFHLFGSENEHRVALNIGGIANVTLLPAGGGAETVRAYDTGPGNMVIDECVRLATGGRQAYDTDGCIARRGTPNEVLLGELLAEPYFSAKAPKSTGRETFGAHYVQRLRARVLEMGIPNDDLVASVTALTARTIAQEIPGECVRVIASGGGVRNGTLMEMLRADLTRRARPAALEVSDSHGVPADAKEAIAFALLACEAVRGRSNHLPSCTGARSGAILGKVVPGSNYVRLMKNAFGS